MKLISLFLVLFLWSTQCSSMKFDVVCVKKHPYDILIKSLNVKRDKTLMNQCFISFFFGGDTRIRTGDQSFADSCLTTWLYRHINKWSGKRGSNPRPSRWQRDALSTELFPQNKA